MPPTEPTGQGDAPSGTWRLIGVKVYRSKFYIFSNGERSHAVSEQFFWRGRD